MAQPSNADATTSMEVLSLFPRYLLKGTLEPRLLEALQQLAR